MTKTTALLLCCVLLPCCVVVTASDSGSSLLVSVGNGTSYKELDSGLEPFRNMVNAFLSIVQTNDLRFIEERITINASDPNFVNNVFRDKWNVWAVYFVGFAICVAVGAVFLVVIPIIGLCTCCCRCCCGKCGGKTREMDRRGTACARNTCGLLLFLLTLVVLAGGILAGVVSVRIYEQLQPRGAVDAIQDALRHTEEYKNSIPPQLQGTLEEFKRTKSQVFVNLYALPDTVTDTIGNATNATSLLNTLSGVNDHIDDLRSNLSELQTVYINLSTSKSQLTPEVDDVANNITGAITNCNTSQCNDIRTDTAAMKIIPDYSVLNVSIALAAVDAAISADIKGGISEGIQGLLNVSNTVNHTAFSVIQGAEKKTDSVIAELDKALSDLSQSLTNISINVAVSSIEKVKPQIQDAGMIWLYCSMALTTIIFVIVILNLSGLLYGACCDRPEGECDCCSKATGANCLLASVAFMFIFSFVFMIIVIPLFAVGGVTHTEACRHLVQYVDSKQISPSLAILNKHGSQALTDAVKVSINVLGVTDHCREDAALYTALNVEAMGDQYNISKIIKLDDIEKELAKIGNLSVSLKDITIMNPTTEGLLYGLISGLQSVNVSAMEAALTQNVTGVDLRTFADKLQGYNASLFDGEIRRMREIHDTTVAKMDEERSRGMRALSSVTQTLLRMPTNDTVQQTKTAQDIIQNNGSDIIKAVLQDAVNSTWNAILATKQTVENQVRYDIGRCSPVYAALARVVQSTCVNTLTPVNAFWFAFGWCIFFFLPSIIFAIKLAGYYRIPEEYSPTRVRDDMYFPPTSHIDIPRASNDMLLHRAERKDIYPVENPIYQQETELVIPRARAQGAGKYPLPAMTQRQEQQRGRVSPRAVHPDPRAVHRDPRADNYDNSWVKPPPYDKASSRF